MRKNHALLRVLLIAAVAMALPRGDAQAGAAATAVTPLVPATAAAASRERYIVVFAPAVADVEEAANALVRAHGGRLGFVYRHALRGFSAELPPAAVEAMTHNPTVAYVEQDQVMRAVEQTVPTGIQRAYAYANPAIGIDGVDDFRVDADIASIDTGVDFDHPDLNVVARTDCTAGNFLFPRCADGSGDDGNGHGTHTAGTMAALDNGIGVVGVAPGARLHAVKVLGDNGSGWNSEIIAGVDWVTAHSSTIDVANMSLGGGNSTALCDAVNRSVDAGIVYAVAAGNDGADAANYSPANCAKVITVSALADFDGAPGGGAAPTCRSDVDDTLADFSNWGRTVEIAAPGVCITSTYKDGGYAVASGTSMASPHVAGAAALLKSKGWSAQAVRDALIASGSVGGWTDESPDGVKEPVLDTSTFTPVLIPTSSPPPVDTTPPAITAGPAASATTTSATITWTTDESSDSVVNYGTTNALGSTTSAPAMVTSHSVLVPDLQPDTAYSYQVRSADAAGNAVVSGTHSFRTAAATEIALSARKYAAKSGQRVALTWSGASPSVAVSLTRNAKLIASVAGTADGTGTYDDNLGKRPKGAYTYQACQGTRCSNAVTVSY